MEDGNFLSFQSSFLRRHLVSLLLGVVGILLIIFSFLPLVFGQKDGASDVVFEAGSESSVSSRQSNSVLSANDSGTSEPTKSSIAITIDVSGAVASPGVITLASNSRVQDAIKAAGGLSTNANNEWIAKNLNLAAKLSDAAKLYIPFVGEQGQTLSATGNTLSVGSDQSSVNGLINVNTAGQAQIEALPGIGPVTAAKIINGRPYLAVEDLLAKKVVGQSVFEKIREQVVAQ